MYLVMKQRTDSYGGFRWAKGQDRETQGQKDKRTGQGDTRTSTESLGYTQTNRGSRGMKWP